MWRRERGRGRGRGGAAVGRVVGKKGAAAGSGSLPRLLDLTGWPCHQQGSPSGSVIEEGMLDSHHQSIFLRSLTCKGHLHIFHWVEQELQQEIMKGIRNFSHTEKSKVEGWGHYLFSMYIHKSNCRMSWDPCFSVTSLDLSLPEQHFIHKSSPQARFAL